MSKSRVAPGLDVAIVIDAPPGRVLKAFFEHEALSAWWQVAHSVTTPRILGPYAIEWAPTDFRDPVLGRLGGVFRGTVMQFQERRGFFVADAFWLPPDGDPIGPMLLEVTCALVEESGDVRFRPAGSVATRVRVTQSGFEESVRWRRYYEVVNDGWERALESLKSLLEH
ncbi:MAG: hypothetical protein DMF92_09470 [Acidobacteria bacterium]|nr:MAG: hypothetical protein DMF92_09470 [Acidobacteriota bacterium]